MKRQLRVAWFSPLAGESVSSYVSNLLLPELARDIDLTIFHNGERRSFSTPTGELQVFHYLKAVELDAAQPFDIFFYQIEDRKECDFMRIHLALKPGIVWFHDFFLSNHGPEPILNSSWSEIIARFTDFKRPWPEHDREYQPGGVLAEREAGMSFMPLFSNPRDMSEYRRFVKRRLAGDKGRCMLLRHPAVQSLFERTNQRRASAPLRLALSALPRVESQVHHLFEALSTMKFDGSLIWPVPESERGRAEALVEEFELASRCEVIGGAGPFAWAEALNGADVGIHLRFSAFGQPSPYLPMTLAAGLPALVTDFAAGAAYPEHVIFKIAPGRAQVAEIAAVLQTIKSLPAECLGKISRKFAREFAQPQSIACQLLAILNAEAAHLSVLSGRWREMEALAQRELMRESLAFEGDQFRSQVNSIYAELGWTSGDSV